MASYPSNKIKYLLATKVIDFANDTFKIALMGTGFTFNRATHHGYADVSASELVTANGYTAGGATLGGVTVTEDDSANLCKVTWTNPTWSATPGNIGPSPGAIIYDDTVSTPTADPVVGYIDFGGDQTQLAGGQGAIANPEFDI